MPQSAANAEMGRYWNEVAGPRWVGRQAVQEARNAEMAMQLHEAAGAALGEHILDVGCGTGVTTAPYAMAVGPTGHVTGIDIAQPMLDAARQRIAAQGLGNVTFLLGDAQTHQFDPESFDLVTSRLGVMFFADPVAAFRNFRGAMKPRGRLVMAVWATIDENTHRKIPYEIAVRWLGPPSPRDPHAPGPYAFGDRAYLRGILETAGFASIGVEPRDFHVHGDTPAGMAEHSALFGAVQRLIEEKSADKAACDAIVGETAKAFLAYQTSEGVRLPARFLLVTARRF